MKPLLGIGAVIAALTAVVGPSYGFFLWVKSQIVTPDQLAELQRAREQSTVQLLINLDRNRITTFEMHLDTLSPGQLSELEGLRDTVKQNVCEQNKDIGLYAADRSC